MKYLLVWIVGLFLGVLFFPEYFLLYIIVLLTLHFVNRKHSGEFTKYVMTTVIPATISQLVSSLFGSQLNAAYSQYLQPFFESAGIAVPTGIADNIPGIAGIILLIAIEPIFVSKAQVPIKKNHTAAMRDILRTEKFKTFSTQLSDMIKEIDEDSQWDPAHFVQLDAEVDIVHKNKVLPRTKNLLRALERSPIRNNISLVIGDPGSGKSVAMRKLCMDLLKKSRVTKRIPLYVNLKNWNKNWDGDGYPTQRDLEHFILSSFEQHGVTLMTKFLKDHFYEIMENGGWFFILDSYDEIPFLSDNAQSTAYNTRVSKVIYKFLTVNRCGGVLSSRPFRSPDTTSFCAENHFRISPFTERQIIELFKKGIKLSTPKCRTLFREHLDVVDLSRTPLIASLVGQYYLVKKSWPSSQKQLYKELMDKRVQDTLRENYIPELTGVSRERIMEVTASIAYLMMKDKRYHSAITLEAAHEQLPYEKKLIAATARLLDSARICKLCGADKSMVTFVHRRFMEFFTTQSEQFTEATIKDNLSDIWTLGNYHDVFVLYGEVCDLDSAKHLAAVCRQIIMSPDNDFRDIRNEPCLHAINSLSFLLHAFRNRKESIANYMESISSKVLWALTDGCSDNVCLAVFATAVPIFSTSYQEAILTSLLNFRYKWISQYLSRIFYQGNKNSDALLLVYIENLKTYGDVAFLKELPIFFFVFAKEMRLRVYCWLRIADILLSATVSAGFATYLVWIVLFSGQITFDLDVLTTWITFFQSLTPMAILFWGSLGAFTLVYVFWTITQYNSLHTICYISTMCYITILLSTSGLQTSAAMALYVFVTLLLVWNIGLSDLVTLRLKFRTTSKKLPRLLKFLASVALIVLLGLFPVLASWFATQFLSAERSYLIHILNFLFWILIVFRPIRFILDTIRLYSALRQIGTASDAPLLRRQLENILRNIRGKYHKTRLISQLYHKNVQLTGNWTSCRPVIGVEKADQMLTALDTKDINVSY